MLKAFEVAREQVQQGATEITVFRVRGYLDAHTAPRFEEALHQAADGQPNLLVDCAQLDYISSAGLGLLIDAYRSARARRGLLKVAGMSPAIAQIFDILGFSKVIQAYPSVAEALESFARPVEEPQR